jgi:hypothetical protein
MAESPPRYRIEVEAPRNGRVRQADVRVRDAEGRLVLTDRADLSAQAELRRVARELAGRLHAQGEELLAALERAWIEALERARAEAAQAPAEADPSTAEVLLELAGAGEYYHAPDGRTYATVPVGEGESSRRDTLPVRSEGFRDWLRRRYWQATGRAVPDGVLPAVVGTLAARARYDGPLVPVYVRLAPRDGGDAGDAGDARPGGIYLDLGDDERRAVLVTAGGWRVIEQPPVRFRRPRGQLPLPVPLRGDTTTGLTRLRGLVRVSDADWPLVLAWLASALCPGGPYPLLCLSGEQGAAKSTTARLLRSLVDPAWPALRAEPGHERDLLIAASGCWVLALDNLSGIRPWLSDALCRLATGGGIGARQLYTDDDEVVVEAQRPVILNGIEDLAERPDLLDRCVLLGLDGIDDDERLTERAYWARADAARPAILGALLDGVAGGLALLADVEADLTSLPRMADAAVWSEAVGRALGLAPGEVIDALVRCRRETSSRALDASLLTAPLRAWMAQAHLPWEGTCDNLLRELTTHAGDLARGRDWPRYPHALSGRLRRLVPALRQHGICVTFPPRRGRGRLVRIERAPGSTPGNGPATASPASQRHQDGASAEEVWCYDDDAGDAVPG